MPRPTIARVDLDAVMHNASEVRRLVGERTICAAVKADAYGHGAPMVAHALCRAGVDMFGVAMVEEGVDLRATGVDRPILVLAAIRPEDVNLALDHDLILSVQELSFARELSARALRKGVCADVHVKIDTGMHRQGFDWDTAADPIAAIAELEGIRIGGIFTHFCCAGANDLSFSREQIARFKSVLERLAEAGLRPPLAHAASSAALLRMPDACFEGVRPGLMLYGLYSRSDERGHADLRPVMSLRTCISHLKRVREGEGVSYGLSWRARRDSLMAVLPVGYHDGYDRQLGNVGEVLVRGHRAPVAGTVCMDQIVVDVTDVPGVQQGDGVVLFGSQGSETVSIEDLSARTDMIPYEFTCGVGRRVPREFLLNGRTVTCEAVRCTADAAAVRRMFEIPDPGRHGEPDRTTDERPSR